MFKNYFKIAWRNLRKNKTFSIINITGLSIGVSCFLLIALVTSIFQTIKAAIANPVKSLRTE
jgi:ABC-type antimicrobial peptide transport system permease subunit